MKIALIVARSKNKAIGKDNQLIWKLPDDLKRFKQLTTGHAIVMGRKTYESIKKALPNRINIIITRDLTYQAEGCVVVNTLEAALAHAKAQGEMECFVVGGGEIYRLALPLAHKIYLTEVEVDLEGDTFFDFDTIQWKEESRQSHGRDEKHEYAFEFVDWVRK